MFFHINLSLANWCLRISYISPSIKNNKYAGSTFLVFNLCDFFQASSQTIVYFLPVAGINHSNIQHHILDQKQEKIHRNKNQRKKELTNNGSGCLKLLHFLKTIEKLQIVMSGNPTGILALFALLPSSVVSIPVHYRPFLTLFFYSKALQTFPLSHIPDSCALGDSLAFNSRKKKKLFLIYSLQMMPPANTEQNSSEFQVSKKYQKFKVWAL